MVALTATLAYVALVGLALQAQGGHIEWFAKFGEEGRLDKIADPALGPGYQRPFVESHDGAVFWLVANDPLARRASEYDGVLDSPTYRYQRILYPLLVSPSALGGPWATLWGLVLVNLLVVGAGTYITARLALTLGATAWGGLAFALDPSVFLSVMLDLADALAIAGLVAFVWCFRKQWWAAAAVAAVVATLTRETAFLGILAVVVLAPGPRRSTRVWMVAPAALLAGTWAAYLRLRFPGSKANVDEQLTLVPFGGFVSAFQRGWSPDGRWGDMVVALLVVGLAVYVAVQWWRRRTIELLVCLPGLVLVPFLQAVVVHQSVNVMRAVGPAVTLAVVDHLAARARRARAGPAVVSSTP